MDEKDEMDEELEKIRQRKLKQMMQTQKKAGEPRVEEPKPGSNLIQLNASNFWDIIRKSDKAIVDCYADWCAPCKMLEPIFTRLAYKYSDITFGRINVDYAQNIAAAFQIRSIPLLLFFRRGQLVNKLLGLQSLNTIEAYIRRLLG
ncbi:MAG: thioredoxin family protein [Candidatus Helarchaeota archaeon]